MPELVLDGLEVGVGGAGQAGGAVPQVVQPHRWQAAQVGQEPQAFREVVRVERLAVGTGEHVAGGPPGAAGDQVVGALAAQVSAQHGDGAPIQGNGATAGRRLGWALDDLVADRGPLVGDGELPVVEVDVVSAQAGGFAAVQTA